MPSRGIMQEHELWLPRRRLSNDMSLPPAGKRPACSKRASKCGRELSMFSKNNQRKKNTCSKKQKRVWKTSNADAQSPLTLQKPQHSPSNYVCALVTSSRNSYKKKHHAIANLVIHSRHLGTNKEKIE